ncbi:MAG: transglutaminase-like domain-containing protein [Holophaga sp.]|nr:transglutaminase-like domain-containing protein [Holophaga sp.]
MVRIPRLAVLCFLLMSWVNAQDSTRFRVWMGGQEVGGREMRVSTEGARARQESREWIRLERLGMAIEQKINQITLRGPNGALEFQWTIQLSQEPMEGRAFWTPAQPRQLRILSKNLPERLVELDEGLVLWPGEIELRLKNAARARQSVVIKGYAAAVQQSTELDLRVMGPDPLPGFPDAVRFKGQSRAGSMISETEVWISPTAGEVKESGLISGLSLLVQRMELPAPHLAAEPEFFARTLNTLPPHPFLVWLPEATLAWKGQGEQRLPEDDQQRKVGPNRIRVMRALLPNAAEASQLPVLGQPGAQDIPYLAQSPLLQFRDPLFDGLVARLRAPKQATRWQLAQAVNRFVFDWISEKDYTVGFASALEVVRRPKGDCTEHGVLAVALLRRLGVPARGAVGWIGTAGIMGLHFWVEVNLNDRWIPIDPTFNEAPASTLHLKLGTTDLADLGSVGWDTAGTQFVGGRWVPEGPWAKAIRTEGDRIFAPGGETLRLPSATWKWSEDVLALRWRGIHLVEAVPHPLAQTLKGARIFESALSHRRGWWQPLEQRLWISLDADHWLQVSSLDQTAALELLDQLEWQPAPRR